MNQFSQKSLEKARKKELRDLPIANKLSKFIRQANKLDYGLVSQKEFRKNASFFYPSNDKILLDSKGNYSMVYYAKKKKVYTYGSFYRQVFNRKIRL